MQTQKLYEILSSANLQLDTMSVVVGVSKVRKLLSIMLVAIAMLVSAAGPAHASGEDAATDTVCNVAYYFYPSYY
jgi:hypothetical protein